MDAFTPPVESPLQEAPGARASFHLGLWAILTCLLFPVSIVLAILSLVQRAKARRLAESFPRNYRQPGAAGLVMAILSFVLIPFMLFFVGVVSAIAIPALLGQRARAQEKVCQANLVQALASLQMQADLTHGEPPAARLASLETQLKQLSASNPLEPSTPAYAPRIVPSEGRDQAALEEALKSRADVPGQCVFMVQFGNGTAASGLLGGAVKTRNLNGEPRHVVRVMSLD